MLKSLPQTQKEKVEKAFKVSKNIREKERLQIIKLLSQGYSYREVSAIVGKSETRIEQIVALFHRKGLTGLKPKPHPKNNSKLTISQKKSVKKILMESGKPSLAGLKVAPEFDFWNIATLKQLVKERFDVWYTCQESYQKLFKWCGFSYQRVEFKDKRRSNEERKDFKERARIRLKKGMLSMSW